MKRRLDGHKIGFAGLGTMGRANARHLLEAGAEVVVWNRSADAAEAAVRMGMRRVLSPADLARQIGDGVICLCLTMPEVVRQVVFGPEGLIEGMGKGAMIIDLGTTGVPATQEFARRVTWVDAPVSGGQVGAETATLTIMAGGTNEAFERALPILRVLGERVTHLGRSGSGQAAKLANQLIVAQTIDAVAQALRLADLAGVDPAMTRQALLGGFAESRVLQLHGERMVRRDFKPGGKAALQLKDVLLICELAEAVGFHSPTLDNCRGQWEKLVHGLGGGELDHSALFNLYEGPHGDRRGSGDGLGLRRSEVNAAIREAREAFARHGWVLPPKPRWDVTDFGLGDFESVGLTIVNLAEQPEYCEKLMFVRQKQVTPTHFHKVKKEDIICRWGRLVVEVPGDAGTESQLQVNGEVRRVEANQPLTLGAGERITLTPGTPHRFWAASSYAIVGEVSTANDDAGDNYFADPRIGRFCRIEEDEPALVKLVSE